MNWEEYTPDAELDEEYRSCEHCHDLQEALRQVVAAMRHYERAEEVLTLGLKQNSERRRLLTARNDLLDALARHQRKHEKGISEEDD